MAGVPCFLFGEVIDVYRSNSGDVRLYDVTDATFDQLMSTHGIAIYIKQTFFGFMQSINGVRDCVYNCLNVTYSVI